MILPSQRFRKDLNSLLESALISVRPETLLKSCVRIEGDTLGIFNEEFHLSEYGNIHMIAMGKGAPSFCRGLTDLIGNSINRGIVISAEQYDPESENIISLKGDHPVPGKNSLNSAGELKQFVKSVNKNDLVIALLTGGSSSMVVSPPEEISLNDLAEVSDLLLRSGAEIEEINTVRKHLSTIKGGKLAKMIHPARIISLTISDVIGSDPETIGSGPFTGDKTTFSDALKIMKKYNVEKKSGKNLIEYLKKGETGVISDTPFPDDPEFKNNRTFIIGKNINALNSAAMAADKLGYRTKILSDEVNGDVRDAAKRFAEMIRNRAGEKGRGKEILLFGGEFTVSVKGKGKGGRVQEFLLSILMELKEETFPYLIAGAGTDGRDGNSDAAGAWIDNRTIIEIEGNPYSTISRYLADNDSNSFFKKIDQLIHTGPTGTNVMDIFMIFLD